MMKHAALILVVWLSSGCYPTALDEWHVTPPFGELVADAAGTGAVTLPIAGGIIVDLDGTPCAMEHERVHQAQVRRLGETRFVSLYSSQNATRGSRMNCLEIEAYTVSRVCMFGLGKDYSPMPVGCLLSETEDCGCN